MARSDAERAGRSRLSEVGHRLGVGVDTTRFMPLPEAQGASVIVALVGSLRAHLDDNGEVVPYQTVRDRLEETI